MPIEEEIKGSKGRRAKQQRVNTSPGRLTALFGAVGGNADDSELHWDTVEPRYVFWVVVETTKRGGAVLFGRSRDGGALSVTVILDDERKTFWISPRDVPEDKLTEIAEAMISLG